MSRFATPNRTRPPVVAVPPPIPVQREPGFKYESIKDQVSRVNMPLKFMLMGHAKHDPLTVVSQQSRISEILIMLWKKASFYHYQVGDIATNRPKKTVIYVANHLPRNFHDTH